MYVSIYVYAYIHICVYVYIYLYMYIYIYTQSPSVCPMFTGIQKQYFIKIKHMCEYVHICANISHMCIYLIAKITKKSL